MSLSSITEILDGHGNSLLNTAAPPVVPRNHHDLSSDQPRAAIDSSVITAAKAALDDGQTHYVDVPGIPVLRQALADYLSNDCGCRYEQSQVIVTAGIQESRFLTLQKIGEAFGHIALPAVVHPGVKQAIGVRPLTVHQLPVDPNTLLPTLAGIEAGLAAGQKLFYLESPTRLTGKTFSSEALATLADMVKTAAATVIWDQGLSPWAGADYTSLAALPDMSSRVATIGEAFPGTGLESWFLGYIAAPAEWVGVMTKQKQIMAICTSTASQYAGVAAAQIFADQRAEQLDRLKQIRQTVVNQVQAAQLAVADGDAASMLALRLAADEKAAVTARLAEAGYGFADGTDFGDSTIVRLAITFDDTIVSACKKMTGES
ncbi:MAG: aminotransferase class I/II-fold pyridoxal phosphate-dependent enzyme [Chloroflexota bacterium]